MANLRITGSHAARLESHFHVAHPRINSKLRGIVERSIIATLHRPAQRDARSRQHQQPDQSAGFPKYFLGTFSAIVPATVTTSYFPTAPIS